jgi:signal transduction histidine kinase
MESYAQNFTAAVKKSQKRPADAMNRAEIRKIEEELSPEHMIANLTMMNKMLTAAAEAASVAFSASVDAQLRESNLAAKVAYDSSNLIIANLRLEFESILASQRTASEIVNGIPQPEMELHNRAFKEGEIVASDASTLILLSLSQKCETAAAATTNLLSSTLHAHRLSAQLALNKFEAESNARLALQRDESKQAALRMSEASALLFFSLRQRYENAAVAAANDSNSSLLAHRLASQLALEEAETEANLRFTDAHNASEEAVSVASKASDSKYHEQKSKFEALSTAAASVADSSLIAERQASRRASEDAMLEANTRIVLERKISELAANIASESYSSKIREQRLAFEAAATAAADASDSLLAAQRQAFQLASDEATIMADSRVMTERNASKQAAVKASEASDTKFLNQKSQYEIAAVAAADASATKTAIEQSIFDTATKLASESFALKLTDNTIHTERLELKAKFALMESEQLRNISANVAHDLKSPLHTLLIGLESMRNNTSSSQAQDAEMLDTLNSACAFMTSAISRTIEFSKTSVGVSLTPSNSSFNLLAALSNPIKWIKSILPADGKKSIALEAFPEGTSFLISDKHWVEENLLCLLSNAVKYSNHGVIRVTVTLENDQVRITVEDNGIGISPEAKLLLFKQFSSAQRMAVGSTGLGLYSLSKRVEAIGGSCGVSDREDEKEGSTFWFTFPYRPDPADETEKGATTPDISVGTPGAGAGAAAGSSRRHLNILIVDDSTSVVKILSNKLVGAGHRVYTAYNGAAGLEKMVAMVGQLDVVFMDVQMPVMDGIEATRRYREIERLEGLGRHLPIICSSANSAGEVEDLALSAGLDSFLPKPFTTATLLSVVEKVISGIVT